MDNESGYVPYQQPPGDYTDSTQGAEGYGGSKDVSKTKPSKPSSKKPPNGELTILASYVWDPAISGVEELAYLTTGKWHPGFADYVDITGPAQVPSPSDLTALLGTIHEFDVGSIKRLNFFTHSNRNTIGIRGILVPGNVMFTTQIDDQVIDDHVASNYTYTFNNNKKDTFVLSDVRARFSEDAIFVLYGCDVGFDPTKLLTSLKNFFQVSIIGFKEKMVFCPPLQKGESFTRKGEKVGIYEKDFKCENNSTREWRTLINHVNAVRVNK